MSAYYPLLMTCASLVVCLWAEVSEIIELSMSYKKKIILELEHGQKVE
jgi:hypothetical protein